MKKKMSSEVVEVYLHWSHFGHCLWTVFGVFRLAEVTNDCEGGERVKKAKPVDAVQTSLADRFTQLQDAENAWKKKVRLSAAKSLGRRRETPRSFSAGAEVFPGALESWPPGLSPAICPGPPPGSVCGEEQDLEAAHISPHC